MKGRQLAIFLIFTLVVVNANPFQQSSLPQVNKVRSGYNLHPLQWDAEMARQATVLASTCSKLAQTPASTKATFGASVVDKLAEESNYNCAADICTGGECNSFRELVSEQNTHIGCGFSLCDGRPFVVCLYNKQHATASRRICRTNFVNKRDVSQTTATTGNFNNINCYINATAAILTARRNEAVRIVEDLNSQVTNALDKVMLTTGVNDTNFCPLVNFVIGLQQDVTKMNIQIEQYYLCNQCQFTTIWANLSTLYAYRKRTITSYILVNYTDTGCQRTLTVYGIGAHFGRLNYLPTANNAFPGPPWHTTLNFWDSDRFQITWQEEANNAGTFKILGLVQYTEATFPLPEGTSTYTGGLVPGRSPFLVPAPGNYNVAPANKACACFATPQTTPCT